MASQFILPLWLSFPSIITDAQPSPRGADATTPSGRCVRETPILPLNTTSDLGTVATRLRISHSDFSHLNPNLRPSPSLTPNLNPTRSRHWSQSSRLSTTEESQMLNPPQYERRQAQKGALRQRSHNLRPTVHQVALETIPRPGDLRENLTPMKSFQRRRKEQAMEAAKTMFLPFCHSSRRDGGP